MQEDATSAALSGKDPALDYILPYHLSPALPPESCLELAAALADLDLLHLPAAFPWGKNDSWHSKLVNSTLISSPKVFDRVVPITFFRPGNLVELPSCCCPKDKS